MRKHLFSQILLLSLTLLSGCLTQPNWNGRVGQYTFEEAVAELGKPTNVTALSNGGKIAEWLIRRGDRGSAGYGMGGEFVSRGFLEPRGRQIAQPTADKYLSLSFGANGKLTAWSHAYR